MLKILIVLLIIGALSSAKTLLHSFALGFDVFCQMFFWNHAIGVTISSRAGLAARRGKPFMAKIVNTIFFNKNHCEEAVVADIARAKEALILLQGSSERE